MKAIKVENFCIQWKSVKDSKEKIKVRNLLYTYNINDRINVKVYPNMTKSILILNFNNINTIQ